METSKDRLVSYACMGPILVVTNLQNLNKTETVALAVLQLPTVDFIANYYPWGCLLEFLLHDQCYLQPYALNQSPFRVESYIKIYQLHELGTV